MSLKRKIALVAAAAAAVGATVAVGMSGAPSANADPKQYTQPIFGFGSDTTQDVMNAFAGFSNNVNFPPLQTSQSTGRQQIVSWNAFPPGAADPTAVSCITTRVGFPATLRANGSGNGHRMLSAAANGSGWPISGTNCGGPKNVGPLINFARSSSGPGTFANTTGPLVWVPFGRDALSFAYLRPSGSPTVSITSDELQDLHALGPQLIGGVPVIACGIQTGSGTYASWMTALGLATDGTGDPGTNLCNNAGSGATLGRVQENNGPDLTGKGTLLAASISDPICDGTAGGAAVACTNAQLVVGFSASQFIARSNNVGTPNPNLGANGGLGEIDGNAAVSGTAPNLVPEAAAYNNTTYGRDVYNILVYNAIVGGNSIPALVDMFNGPTSKVCAATATIQQHGFRAIANCGETITRGNYRLT